VELAMQHFLTRNNGHHQQLPTQQQKQYQHHQQRHYVYQHNGGRTKKFRTNFTGEPFMGTFARSH
jgi:hypothetical protein